MQSAQLPACKAADPALGKVYSQVLQDVLHRVDKTYQAFFRRGRGFPRFKGKGWYDSFTYPQAGFGVNGGRLSLSKIGNVKIKLHRSLQGEVKTLTLKNENGKWYACFSSILDSEPLPENHDAIGTSQQCPCGRAVPKQLWDRKHHCLACGLETIRDHASALEILRRGLRLRTETPALAGVALEAPSFSYGA